MPIEVEIIGRVFKFEKHVFARHADLYNRLAINGQSPKALMISCADSRIVPELILQAEPGDLLVTRNAGHIRLHLAGLTVLDHTCAEVLADWIQRSRKAGARVELVGTSEIHTGNSHRRLAEAASL